MIRRFLDLSTMHLDRESRTWLDDHSGSLPVGGYTSAVGQMPYGWIGYAPETEQTLGKMPKVLQDIAIFARKNGCEYMLFDSDGGVLRDLKVFDEDTDEELCGDGELVEIDVRRQPCEARGICREDVHPELRDQCPLPEVQELAVAE